MRTCTYRYWAVHCPVNFIKLKSIPGKAEEELMLWLLQEMVRTETLSLFNAHPWCVRLVHGMHRLHVDPHDSVGDGQTGVDVVF